MGKKTENTEEISETGAALINEAAAQQPGTAEAGQYSALGFGDYLLNAPDSYVEDVARLAGEELLRRNISNLTPEQQRQKINEDRLKMYGEGYVVAKNGDLEQIFTRQSWSALAGNRQGWEEIVETPQEVKSLKK